MKSKNKIIVRVISVFFFSVAVSSLQVTAIGQGTSDRKTSLETTDVKEKLRNAKVIFIKSESRYARNEELENEILKQPEVIQWGLLITRNESEADLIFEVTRKRWSRKYTFVVIDPLTNLVLLTGKVQDKLFSRVEHKIARRFVEQMSKQ